MRLQSISAITKILTPVYAGTKNLFCLGAKHAKEYLLEPFCYSNPSKIPSPNKIFDFNPNNFPPEIDGIPVLPLNTLKDFRAEENVILIAAEDQEFYSYLGALYDELHCYYFPILPCTALEAYFYAVSHEEEIYSTMHNFWDEKSRKIYMDYWESRISGCVYNPALYCGEPYWGNDIIPHLNNKGTIILGGAYNGLHIDRIPQNNTNYNVMLFEPNLKWENFLKKKYENNPQIMVFPQALYNTTSMANFDTSNELGAQICANGNCMVQTVRLDDFNISDVSIIALDIEGAELEALEGATNTIRLCKPILAICSYHKISDYVDIPKYINSLEENYKLLFRQHSCYYEESVIYAIPY